MILADTSIWCEAAEFRDACASGTDEEVLRMITNEQIAGSGIGYVDCHLLASVRLTRDAKLWTHDRKLYALAARLGVNRPMTAY